LSQARTNQSPDVTAANEDSQKNLMTQEQLKQRQEEKKQDDGSPDGAEENTLDNSRSLSK